VGPRHHVLAHHPALPDQPTPHVRVQMQSERRQLAYRRHRVMSVLSVSVWEVALLAMAITWRRAVRVEIADIVRGSPRGVSDGSDVGLWSYLVALCVLQHA
jgi:hypothetical protein